MAYHFTDEVLRAISTAWAANWTQDSGFVDEVLDETLATDGFDQLAGQPVTRSSLESVPGTSARRVRGLVGWSTAARSPAARYACRPPLGVGLSGRFVEGSTLRWPYCSFRPAPRRRPTGPRWPYGPAYRRSLIGNVASDFLDALRESISAVE